MNTTVTYFRTTLGPHDLHLIEDIINNGGENNTATPATALATHLRNLNPNLQWHTIYKKPSVETQATWAIARKHGLDFDDVSATAHTYFYLDAIVFDNGETTPTVIASLRHDMDYSPEVFPRTVEVQAPKDSLTCAAYATTLPVYERPERCATEPYRKLPESQLDTDTAERLANMDKNVVTYVHVLAHSGENVADSSTIVDNENSYDTDVEGFQPVPWTSLAWDVTERPGPDDTVDTNGPAIVSNIIQGPDFALLIEATVL